MSLLFPRDPWASKAVWSLCHWLHLGLSAVWIEKASQQVWRPSLSSSSKADVTESTASWTCGLGTSLPSLMALSHLRTTRITSSKRIKCQTLQVTIASWGALKQKVDLLWWKEELVKWSQIVCGDLRSLMKSDLKACTLLLKWTRVASPRWARLLRLWLRTPILVARFLAMEGKTAW